MQHSDSTKELFEGFAKFRAQVKQPVKAADNPYFNSKYVTLEGVMQSIDTALPGTGLAYCQLVENCQDGVSVSTLITHSSGEWMMVGPLTLAPVERNPQGYGSAITYAKRYQLASVFGISGDVDDDGNAGTFGGGNAGSQQVQAPEEEFGVTRRQEVEQTAKEIEIGGVTLLDLCKRAKSEGKESSASAIVHKWASAAANDQINAKRRILLADISRFGLA
jgi:hypothetical protein